MNIDNQSINSKAATRWIEMVQKQLIRENPSALPEYGVDGSYGPETVKWVEKFQNRKGLVVDGNAGPNTLSTLRSSIALLPGMEGRGVELLQKDLLYFYIQQSTVDGSYGPKTEQGVRDFQFLNDLVVDGNGGPNTLKKMDEYITTLVIQRGDNGSHVRRIQNQLNEQQEVSLSVTVDGNYGHGTESAIEKFQETTSLTVDGVAGPRTRYLLNAENTPLFSVDKLETELGNFGFTFKESSKADLERFSTLFRNHPEVVKVMDGDNFANVYTAEMDYPEGSKDNEAVFVVADVEGKSNLSVSGQFFKNSEELKTFAVIDVFGNLPSDDVEIKTYNIDNSGVSVESVSERNVDLENSILQSQITFQEAVLESKATEAKLMFFGNDTVSSQNGFSTQGYEDIIGISCGIAISVSGNVLGSSIAATFGLAAGPLGITALVSTAIFAVGSYYFCQWLEEQF